MKLASTALSLLLIAPPAHDGGPGEPLSLVPACDPGLELGLRSTARWTAELDDVLVGSLGLEQPLPIHMEAAVEVSEAREERVLEVADGGPSALQVEVTERTASLTLLGQEPGRDDLEIEEDLELSPHGRTLRLDRAEGGGVRVEELVDPEDEPGEEAGAEAGEELDEAHVRHWRLAPHFAHLLPAAPVEVGQPFELDGQWAGELGAGEVRQLADAVHGRSHMDGPAIATSAAWVLEELELEGHGVVTAVEDGVAVIEYEFEGAFDVEDLVEMLAAADPPGEGGAGPPEGAFGTASGKVSLGGEGRFDLRARQLVELELEGDFTVDVVLDVGVRSAATVAGELAYSAAIEVR